LVDRSQIKDPVYAGFFIGVVAKGDAKRGRGKSNALMALLDLILDKIIQLNKS